MERPRALEQPVAVLNAASEAATPTGSALPEVDVRLINSLL